MTAPEPDAVVDPAAGPAVETDAGPFLTWWHVRAALAVVTGALVVTSLHRLVTDPIVLGLIALGVAALVVLRPAVPTPHLVVAGAGAVLLIGGTTFDPWVLALLPLAYATVRLAWWAAHLTVGARMERAALGGDLRRGAVVVGASEALGLLALLASGLPRTPAAVVLGAVAIAALALLLVPRTWWR
ncbi:hypothetical protein [Oerskovia flava]|uniref:hypothetical protein n=1 Tax=Oerskovia flava TaxID=2986422 RepID=UPI00223FC276|nr:hypothetical protein [Oerskovia sp. JB1-3-2]